MSISSDDAFRDLLKRRASLQARSTLLPLTGISNIPADKDLRKTQPILGQIQTLDRSPSIPFTLEPTTNGRLRFVLPGPLPFTPLALLIGRSLHTVTGEAAEGVIEYPQVERKSEATQPAATLFEIPLAADDHPPLVDSSPLDAQRFTAASDHARWSYDANDPEDCLEIAVRAPADAAPVWAEVRIESRENPQLHATRYVRFTGRPTADGFLRANVFDAAPHSFGPSVSVRVALVSTLDPQQTEMVLSEKQFAALPLTADAEGGWSCLAPRDDQWAAASDPLNDWALRVVANQEVRS